jgi:hypothetical protein
MKRCTLSLLVVIATFSLVGPAAGQEPRVADCPQIMASCPEWTNSQSIFFTATVRSVPNVRYVWTVSSGTITQGQGTTAIRVRVGDSRSITATIEMMGLPTECGNKASCTIIGEWAPKARKFDEYRLDCKAWGSQRSKPKRRKTRKRIRRSLSQPNRPGVRDRMLQLSVLLQPEIRFSRSH